MNIPASQEPMKLLRVLRRFMYLLILREYFTLSPSWFSTFAHFQLPMRFHPNTHAPLLVARAHHHLA
jgi:hypothetical protein